MKLLTFFTFVSVAFVTANSYSQETKFNMEFENAPIGHIFKAIENNSEFIILYSEKSIDVDRKVSLNVNNETVTSILNKVFKGTSNYYEIYDRQIAIMSKESMDRPSIDGKLKNSLQEMEVTGTVTDKDGSPLPGVNIAEKGTTNGVITNLTGEYTINVSTPDATLSFSYVGFLIEEIMVGGKTTIDVTLIEDIKSLEEVVVIGYGTQRKRDITGAISNIDVSKIADVPVSNVSRLLLGQASGVSVYQPTGAPGKEFEIIIRGMSSIGAGSRPLYVIDGFPVGTSIGQNLHPNDIEAITILKDAVSTAIYGAQGSNGVVLITTKNAKKGGVKLDVTVNYGIQNIPDSRKTKVLNGEEFAQFKKDVYMDKIRYFQNREPSIDEVPVDYRYPEQTSVSTNWFDAILNQNARFRDYNITLSEGNGDIHSLLSVGVLSQEGALINTKFDNYSARANIKGTINDYINFGLNINGSFSKQNYTESEGYYDVVGVSLLADPREPIYNEDGTYNNYIGGHDGIMGFYNPVQYLNEIERNLDIGDLIANGFFEITFLRYFKFKSTINARYSNSLRKEFVPSSISARSSPAPRDATEEDIAVFSTNYSTDQLITYDREIGNHKVNALFGFTAQDVNTKGLSGTGSQFSSDLTPYLSSAALKSEDSYEYGWSMNAYFGRLNYSYKDKYLFSGTLRREGCSRFGSNNRYGNFPAVSAGWRISKERFMSGISWLDDLKARASWGVTGNNNIGNYSSLAFMNNNNYIFGNSYASGYVVGSFPNTELGWEKSKQLDIGLDLSAFNNRFTFSAEYYNRITSDMLMSIQIPSISGFNSSLSNVGKVRNKGYEFTLAYKTRINEVNLRSNFNISFNRNKIIEIRGENEEIWSGKLYDYYSVSKVGRPIGMMYGFKVLGIFNNQDEIDSSPTQSGAIPGVYKYFDGDGNGEISYDTKDMVEIGNPWPKYTWGLTLGGDYKNFDFNILLNGAMGYDILRRIEASTMNMDGVFNVLVESEERWRSEENPGSGKYATSNTWKWERETNSRYVYDGSHMWIKNVSLGYTLPKQKLQYCGLRIYLSIDNLYLLTNYPGNNPDINNNGGINPGYDSEAYPIPRTISIGANITF